MSNLNISKDQRKKHRPYYKVVLVHTVLSLNITWCQKWDAYVTDLKNKASLCEFSTLKDSSIRDMIVCGIRSEEVRARLLRDPDLTLVKAIDACRAAETSQTQFKRSD